MPSRGTDPLDQRLDQRLDRLMSAGRQLVDGVSGARPGGRPGGRSRDGRPSARAGFEGLGRWVEDRLDWLLEDEDDWREPWQQPSPPPLRPEARSPVGPSGDPNRDRDRDSGREARLRRQEEPAPRSSRLPAVEARAGADPGSPARPRRALEAKSRRQGRSLAEGLENWPEPEDFQVNRWQRPSGSQSTPSQPSARATADPARSDRRSAPITPEDPWTTAPQRPADPGRSGGRPLPRSSRRRD